MSEAIKQKIEHCLNKTCDHFRYQQGTLSPDQINLIALFCDKLDCDMYTILTYDELSQLEIN